MNNSYELRLLIEYESDGARSESKLISNAEYFSTIFLSIEQRIFTIMMRYSWHPGIQNSSNNRTNGASEKK